MDESDRKMILAGEDIVCFMAIRYSHKKHVLYVVCGTHVLDAR